MKAMILAAGEGRRMRPLTNHTPKPLLCVGGRSLLHHLLMKLKNAGFKDVVINVSYLGQQIIDAFGDGSQLGMCIQYSIEDTPLETGGAIYKARHLLGAPPFLLVNADVWCDYPFDEVSQLHVDEGGAQLVLVPNPSHNPNGDFALDPDGFLHQSDEFERFTFSGISLIDPSLVLDYPQLRQKFPLIEVFNWAIAQEKLRGLIYEGLWMDVGTPDRLEQISNLVSER